MKNILFSLLVCLCCSCVTLVQLLPHRRPTIQQPQCPLLPHPPTRILSGHHYCIRISWCFFNSSLTLFFSFDLIFSNHCCGSRFFVVIFIPFKAKIFTWRSYFIKTEYFFINSENPCIKFLIRIRNTAINKFWYVYCCF